MSHRVVTDAAGRRWQVWAVTPGAHTGRSPVGISPEFARGWLAFEQLDVPAAGRAEKRRLTPVPAGWELTSEPQVLGWLAHATPVTPVTPTPVRAQAAASAARPAPGPTRTA
jgi:hypothetical protein